MMLFDDIIDVLYDIYNQATREKSHFYVSKCALTLIEEIKNHRYVLKQIVESLPKNRDWLDPEIEKIARDLVKSANS